MTEEEENKGDWQESEKERKKEVPNKEDEKGLKERKMQRRWRNKQETEKGHLKKDT